MLVEVIFSQKHTVNVASSSSSTIGELAPISNAPWAKITPESQKQDLVHKTSKGMCAFCSSNRGPQKQDLSSLSEHTLGTKAPATSLLPAYWGRRSNTAVYLLTPKERLERTWTSEELYYQLAYVGHPGTGSSKVRPSHMFSSIRTMSHWGQSDMRYRRDKILPSWIKSIKTTHDLCTGQWARHIPWQSYICSHYKMCMVLSFYYFLICYLVYMLPLYQIPLYSVTEISWQFYSYT